MSKLTMTPKMQAKISNVRCPTCGKLLVSNRQLLALVCELKDKKLPQTEIGNTLGIAQSTVSKMLMVASRYDVNTIKQNGIYALWKRMARRVETESIPRNVDGETTSDR
jgi:predicted transcriptional regulator